MYCRNCKSFRTSHCCETQKIGVWTIQLVPKWQFDMACVMLMNNVKKFGKWSSKY